jgi:spoIIIJ-associated protein
VSDLDAVTEHLDDTDPASEAASPQTGAREAESEADGSEAEVEASGDERSADADALLVREGDIAADYLERRLDIADVDGDIDLDVENDRAVVAIVGTGLESLIGSRGETLDALQELTRLAVAQQTGSRSRLMLDISGHRQARRSELAALARDAAARVQENGEAARLAPMNPFERKVIHDAVAAIDGVRSESEGEEPNRRVVVLADR